MENLDAVRAGLGPRALLTVWPDLQPDVGAVLTALPSEWHIEFVWETKDGTIRDVTAEETQYQELAALVADARAARALSLYTDERSPLLQAALPDTTACCAHDGDPIHEPKLRSCHGTGSAGEWGRSRHPTCHRRSFSQAPGQSDRQTLSLSVMGKVRTARSGTPNTD
ncbi:hypothetical protein [Streptomyces solaniscabiei]|uniref:hypothetical protein n=1 Tax=Streptomyces solaniscabiei TaxID=2683255 RepID=UPI001CE31D98|nr:hypothetical protein [Streptomyces solaniscabiei]